MTKDVSSATIRSNTTTRISGALMFINRPNQLVLFSLVVAVSLLVAACSRSGNAVSVDLKPTQDNPLLIEPVIQDADITPVEPEDSPIGWGDDLTKVDNQGAVEVVVKPVNLEYPGETIEFEIALDTHSVDLSMDLADLAILRTDMGLEVKAAAWDAPRGGHHVGGILSFPASVNGDFVLEEAVEFQLVISGLDAPERIFVWKKQ
jgi:hypothetical protein